MVGYKGMYRWGKSGGDLLRLLKLDCFCFKILNQISSVKIQDLVKSVSATVNFNILKSLTSKL